MLPLNAGTLGRGQDVAFEFPRHQIAELAIRSGGLGVLEALADDRGGEPGVHRDVLPEEAETAVVVHVGVGEQHAAEVLHPAAVRPAAVAGPQVRLVGPEVVAVEALERRQQLHPEIVAQPQRRRPRLDELGEVLAGGAEADAEVEQPAGAVPLEQDAVAADLAGTAVEGDLKLGHDSRS